MPLSVPSPTYIICRAAGRFWPRCQIISLQAARLVKSVYLPSHSDVMCQRCKGPRVLLRPPSQHSLQPCFHQNAFPSWAWHRSAVQEPQKPRAGNQTPRGEAAAAGDGVPHRGKTNPNISGLFKISPAYIYSSARGCSD